MLVIRPNMLMDVNCMCLAWVITHVLRLGLVVDFDILWVSLTKKQKDCVSIARDCYLMIMLSSMPTHVLLSTCTKVLGFGWPIS